METHKLIYYLRKWTNIKDEEAGVILTAFEPISLKKKEELIVPGETCEYIYFITKGCVRSYFVDDKGNDRNNFV